VVSCYNCHFESQAEAGVKRALRPVSGFVLLVNRDKDGKVHPATFQSLTYRGKSFVALAPYSAHAVSRKGRGCNECHVGGERGGSNAATEDYSATGILRFSSWDGENQELRWNRGVIPVPEDWKTSLRMVFMTFTGEPSSPPGKDAGAWTALESDRPDGTQMLFARPLTREQMERIGFREKEGKFD